MQSCRALSVGSTVQKGDGNTQPLDGRRRKSRIFLLLTSSTVSRLLFRNAGSAASTDPGGKETALRFLAGRSAAGATCMAGFGGPAFFIPLTGCGDGDFLGAVRFSRALGCCCGCPCVALQGTLCIPPLSRLTAGMQLLSVGRLEF